MINENFVILNAFINLLGGLNYKIGTLQGKDKTSSTRFSFACQLLKIL